MKKRIAIIFSMISLFVSFISNSALASVNSLLPNAGEEKMKFFTILGGIIILFVALCFFFLKKKKKDYEPETKEKEDSDDAQ